MKRLIGVLAGLAGLGVIGAAAIVGLGLYNVSAQVGHLPGVSWVLHTTFRSSVRLRAPSMEKAPDLDDPDLIALGGGHYLTACAMCHGLPGRDDRSATARAMVPEPPPIDEAVQHWQPNELHWIIENGVKMTGMPGWPAKDRSDEVWSVVAWLGTVRQGQAARIPVTELSGAAYCRGCHERVAGPVPRLDILTREYVAAQAEAYLNGTRPSGIMAQALSLISRDDIADLAADLSGPDAPVAPVQLAQDGPGAELAATGTRDVPACLSCHGTDRRKGPRLAGQPQAYLATQLRLWRDGPYGHDQLMAAAARDLSDEDIDLLSRYFAGSAN